MAYRQRNNPINTPVLKVEMEDDVMELIDNLETQV